MKKEELDKVSNLNKQIAKLRNQYNLIEETLLSGKNNDEINLIKLILLNSDLISTKEILRKYISLIEKKIDDLTSELQKLYYNQL